jgi:DNA ligase-1
MDLKERCAYIRSLFDNLEISSGKIIKETLVSTFREKYPELNDDLDCCFEVLAGKHKVGYTYQIRFQIPYKEGIYENYTIRAMIEHLKTIDATYDGVSLANACIAPSIREFIALLVNREYRLGYSNKNNMITNCSPMLAKKYPDSAHEQYYYVQEKLDGNRCIAHYNFEESKWKFTSRSGKPLKVNFDMSWANEEDIFDGEVMTLGRAGSRDFNRTSGLINGKYTDKSELHYFIYDIIKPDLKYEQRKVLLDDYEAKGTGQTCQILPVLDKVAVYINPEYNWKLDEWLDKIVDKGGEGLILRDPDGYYQCGKRSDALLKYKQLQTMDLRIVSWNEGNGKYEGAIGSFYCETDDKFVRVNVSGMSDEMHYSDPEQWIGKIIEVAYFDTSVSKGRDYISLRFPRLLKIRDDKDSTSIY